MKKKNNMVELCRFLACYVIFSYHAGGRFTTGWIFVEFFFMLSGYFAIKHLVRMEGKIENKATYPIQYTIDKFKRLLPYTTVGFVADCLISAWKYQFTGMELVKWILYLPVNLFYLAGTGMMPADVPISDTVQTSYIMGGGTVVYLCDVCGNAGHDVSVSVPGKKDRSVAHQFSADAAIWIPDYL